MSGDVIRAALIADVTDNPGGAAAIQALNPGMFSGPSAVPAWCYTSLKTLLLGDSATAQQLADAVSPNYGTKLSQATGIDIIFDSSESVDDTQGMKVDQTGWEAGIFIVFARLSWPVTSAQYETIKQIHMRIKTILDARTRIESGLKPGTLNPFASADPIIDPNELYLCSYLRYGSVENAAERASIYRARYRTRLPKLA